MALQEKVTKKNQQDSTIGPVMQSDGLPPNPADTLRTGPLPTRRFPDTTGRHDFSIPTRPTLHRQDGLDGAAEVVTSGVERRFQNDTDRPPYPGTQEVDVDDTGVDFGANPGTDRNRYSQDTNDAYTKNGVLIRGT